MNLKAIFYNGLIYICTAVHWLAKTYYNQFCEDTEWRLEDPQIGMDGEGDDDPYTYIYIYIYWEREREREKENFALFYQQ